MSRQRNKHFARGCCMLAHPGFSLIELMIALVVMAILAALAYPSYQESIRKARRAEAKAALTRLMQQQERYYAVHASYIGFSSASVNDDEKRFQWYSGDHPKTSAYEISGAACKGQTLQACVELVAKPGTAMVNSAFVDPACGELSLTSAGLKTPADPVCW